MGPQQSLDGRTRALFKSAVELVAGVSSTGRLLETAVPRADRGVAHGVRLFVDDLSLDAQRLPPTLNAGGLRDIGVIRTCRSGSYGFKGAKDSILSENNRTEIPIST